MVTTAGADDIRTYIKNNWSDIALLNNNGNVLLQVDWSADGRFSITDGDSANPLAVSGTVEGGDSEFSLPVTISEAQLRTSGGTTGLASEVFTDATLQASVDTLDIDVSITTN